MEKPIRWGVVGASNFAKTVMAPAIHMARGADLVAVATRDASKAEPFAAFCPGLRVETDYEALLAAEDIDALYVPLPNHLHVGWVKKALAAGKHVLCEKPIAMEASDFDGMIEARDRAGRLAAEGYMIVHHPQWQRAKVLLAEGAIGKLRHAETVFTFNDPSETNFRNRAGTGGGALRDLGVYTMGCVRFATGKEPESLTARLETELDFDTTAEVSARFDGFTFHCLVSTRMFDRQNVVFHGTEGTLELTAPFTAHNFDRTELILETGGRVRQVERFQEVNQYVHQVETFCEVARSGGDYPWTLEMARGTQAMIDAAIASPQTP